MVFEDTGEVFGGQKPVPTLSENTNGLGKQIPYPDLGEFCMSETRSRIRDCIDRNPGIHFNDITRQLDIATGQTQYHLRKLCRSDKLQKEALAGRSHYFPPTYSPWERRTIALLRRETSREIVLYVLRNDQAAPAEIAAHLDLARSSVEWHLSRLVEHNVAQKEQMETDSSRVIVTLADEQRVYRLLREIEPRLLDRLVDRFSRLTDELLDE